MAVVECWCLKAGLFEVVSFVEGCLSGGGGRRRGGGGGRWWRCGSGGGRLKKELGFKYKI